MWANVTNTNRSNCIVQKRSFSTLKSVITRTDATRERVQPVLGLSIEKPRLITKIISENYRIPKPQLKQD